ncbi:hypothetical protein [Gordonia sp. SND2]|uniref:hypothetical protein n=1 Tax=Gordonia sp. SND2 TaxID=3388659 RepID=UPI00398B03BF
MSIEGTTIDAVLDRLAEHIQNVWIDDKYPPNDQLETNVPAIIIEDMPGFTSDIPLGGSPLVHEIAIDITILAKDLATARTIGSAVERIIFAMVLDADNTVSHVSQPVTMHKRPDWNSRVSRVGAEFSLRVSTAR